MTGFFKRWRWALGIAAVLMASLIFALRPQPVLVDVGRVSRGPMAVSIRDDGVTRAEDYYIVSAPVTGYMSRIDMDVGDTVRKNDRIATLIGTPAPPLDRRTERELQAALVAARANMRGTPAALSPAAGTQTLCAPFQT
jgi:HlyD family secretion protein